MTQKEIINLFKRFLITFFIIGLPLVCVLTLVAKLESVFVILISVAVVGLVFMLEEYLISRRNRKRKERREREDER